MTLLRSLLFVPAARQRTIDSAVRSDADAVILDLEDSVPADGKQAARELAASSLAPIRAARKTAMVRVNGLDTELTRDDLLATVCGELDAVVLPKVQAPQDLRDLDVLLREAEMAAGVRPGTVGVIPIIESARGVLRCEAIAQAVDRLVGIAIGGEDYTADIEVERGAEGLALQHIRGVVVQVATAYGLTSVDAPYIDFKDEKGLERDAQIARGIGLKGKFVLHPDQVAVVNNVFAPTAADVTRASRIVEAYDARDEGVAAINVDGRMVDAPVVARARAVLDMASRLKAPRVRRA
jgi:citrate lyase subunit beta/citryl-CoA lyase